MRLIYIPLEQYDCRYTEFLSSANGVVETQLKRLKVPYEVIRPHNRVSTIKHGQVLDTVARCKWGFDQTDRLVSMIFDGSIKKDDVLYFEDFWHPGFEMIPYSLSLKFGYDRAKWPRIFSFCHAQSVDPHDFTHKMAWFMRPLEQGWAKVQDGIFTAAPELVELLKEGHIVNGLAMGTVFDSEVLKKFLVPNGQFVRGNRVVFSSRWDSEKNPDFFCNLADQVLKERDDVTFIVCSGFPTLQSNDPSLVTLAKLMEERYPGRFTIKTGIPRSVYYMYLRTSKVQFNCADQDFVSYTLLEAATFGCLPLYPDYLTFGPALHNNQTHLYEKNNIENAKEKLYALLKEPTQDLSWIYEKYERSLQRMLHWMGFNVPKTLSLEEELAVWTAE